MKKVLLIIVCCLFFFGCQNKNSIKNNDSKVDKSKNQNISSKYTFCYITSKNERLTWTFYYDNNYNVFEDFTIISKTYDSLSEAIENENIQKNKCNHVIETVECTVLRSNLTVDNGYKNFNPNYDYYTKINELETDGWICEELNK